MCTVPGPITVQPSTGALIPALTADKARIAMPATPHRPSTHSTVLRSIRWGAIAPPVEATSAPLPMRVTTSPTAHGAITAPPSTGAQRPVPTVDTAPMSTPVIRLPMVAGPPFPTPSTAGRQAAPAATVPRRRQTIPLPTVHGLLFRTRNTVEARPAPAVTAAQKRNPIRMRTTMAPVTIAAI